MPLTLESTVAAPPRNRRERSALALAVLVIALLLAASRWQAYRELEAGEHHSLRAQARAIEDSLQRELVAVRSALTGLRDDLQKYPPAERQKFIGLRLAALANAMPGVRSMHVLDVQGRMWASSVPELVGRDFSNREYLREILKQPQHDRMYLSEPFVTATGAHTVTLSVVLLDPAGAYGGVVQAALEPEYLRTLIGTTLYAGDMSGLVVHGHSGRILVQHPEPALGEEIPDTLLTPDSPIGRHLQSGARAQVLTAALPASAGQPGPVRLLVLRSVQPPELQMDWPLLLVLGRDRAAVFAGWERQNRGMGVLLLVVSALAWYTLVVMQRRRAHDESVAAAAATRKAADNGRLLLALSGGDLALWDAWLISGETVVNDRWHTMLGFSRAEYDAGRADWETLLHPEDRARVLAQLQAHLNGQTPAYEASYRLRHRQGHWVWVLDRGRVVQRDEQGRALRMVGTHMDISQRMQAEQALRASQAHLSELAAALPGPVARLDRQGRYLFTNAACDQWFGHGPLLGRSWRDHYPADVRAVIESEMSLAMAGQARTFDATLPTVSGPRDSIVSLVPDREASGAVRGCFVVVTDIGQRKRAEAALRNSEGQLRMASRLARVAGWRVDLLSRQVSLHDEFCAMLGVPPGHVFAGDQGFRFVAPDSRDAIGLHANRCREQGTPFDIEIDAETADGRALRLRVMGQPVRDPNGRIVALEGASQDITENHAASAQLQRLQGERLALERQLRESQKMESMGTLAGGIAHDFNNILPAILGNVALARAELIDLPPSHAAIQSLDHINAAALRARSLVQQILTFSRRGPGALQPQPVRPVVEETVTLLRATLPATVRLDALLADQTLVVAGDSTQLQQVLMNLCTNAWHALPDGHGRIEVGLQPMSAAEAAALALNGLPEGPCVHLWVRDDGSGIDAATLPRIFDPFFTTKAVGHGTGLGLSVVHGIVRAHQGAITVDSQPGAGSTFHFYLPLQALPDAPPVAVGERPHGAAGQGQPLLYVDDDEVMVLLVQRLLERDGYRVCTSSTAADALAQVRSTPEAFDLVITDFNMPGMSGLELARALAALRPELPVIITSGYLTDRLRSDAKAVGVWALLRKENTLEKLPELVARVLAPSVARSTG